MSKKTKLVKFVGLWFIFAFSLNISFAQSGGTYNLLNSVIASGGGSGSAGGNYIISGTVGQAFAGTTSSGGNYSLRGGFWTPNQFSPTAARVTISGRVFSGKGAGIIRRVRVLLVDTFSGIERTTQTSIDGTYRFEEVEVGKFYIVRAESKNFVFTPDNYALQLVEELENLDFTGNRISKPEEQ